jgi:glucokinase
MTMPPTQGSAPPVLVGVDVGGTKVAVLVADQRRHVLAHTRQPTDVSHPERTLASIASAIQQSLSLAGVSLRDVAAVGVGIPGQVDLRPG